MLNQIVMVGRLVDEPTKEGLTIAIPRSYKNSEGVYETDFIKVRMFENIATNVCEYCRKGDIIGVKGRLQNDDHNNIEVVAEKITFLSSKHNDDQNA